MTQTNTKWSAAEKPHTKYLRKIEASSNTEPPHIRQRLENKTEHVLVPKSGSSYVIWRHLSIKPDDHKQVQTLDRVYLQVIAAPQTNKITVL